MNTEIIQDKLNELLSSVYDLADMSTDVSKEKRDAKISECVKMVEEMVDSNDTMNGDFK